MIWAKSTGVSMGGSGSGRRSQARKAAVDDLERVDIREEARAWPLEPGEQIGLPAWDGLQWTRVWVALSFTPCHFGGARPWFNCPGCGRRVAILYHRRQWWLCRTCLDLAFSSSQEGELDRAIRRVRKLRGRLDGSETIFDPWPRRPPGMHWHTYWKLTAALQVATAKAIAHTARPNGKARIWPT